MFRTDLQRMVAATLTAAVLAAGGATVAGQEPRLAAPGIPSLTEPGQGLDVRARAADGRVTFASRAGRGVLLRGMQGAPASERALAFVDGYGEAFGLRAGTDARVVEPGRRDALGQEHVRLQQLHDGVPVTAAELIVHLEGDRVVGANGRTLADLPALPGASLTAPAAVEAAQTLIGKHIADQAAGAQYSQPRLEVFNRGMIDVGSYPTRLAWFVEATGDQLREFIWIDAYSGAVLLNFSQLTEAKNRTVYNMNHDATQSNLPGVLARSEGQGPVADADVNQAYDFAGLTYDYYAANHGRDSFDNAGGQLRSSVHFGTNYQNAFWNGTQMVYGDGFTAADDVVAHELTHAVTERSAGLLYYNQSGALNESYSDIFGETVDLTSGLTGSDLPAHRWLLAEDLSIGAIRNMMNPNAFGDPGKMSDSAQFVCRSDAWTNPSGDSGGVHSNSGVPNHAFALMVDGGSFNGRTATGIGFTKAAKIQYRALTTYLTSGSGFADNANALNQSCSDLIGTLGITNSDCTQVATAIAAVEMTNTWPCTGATPPPATYCPAGGNPVALFADGFESGGVNWTASSTSAKNWAVDTGLAETGVAMAFGPDVDVLSDHRFAMTNAVTLPANARMSFDHAFEFEHSSTAFYDGGVLEYSTNNGASWIDAGSLIDAGQAYNGALSTSFSNPLGGRTAFARSSFGYTATRLNLASLAGQSVRFRFRVGTDVNTASLGWAVDNVRLYTCGSDTGGGAQPPTNLYAASIVGNTLTLRWTPPASGPAPTGYVLEGGVNPGEVLASIPTGSTAAFYTIVAPTGSFYVRMKTLTASGASVASNEVRVHVNVPVAPSAPANLLGMVNWQQRCARVAQYLRRRFARRT